ncbi:MAG: hypothetical protein JKY90_03470 [Gammaproteobacteria bacterium]|nr:hypothetical protein [Gammaproteobacteria bacterium]
MKLMTVSLLLLTVALPLSSANADNMGRLNGYAKAHGKAVKTLPVADVIVVDKSNTTSNQGRLSGYDKVSGNVVEKRETIPVLAGMREIKPVKNTQGFGRLNGYSGGIDEKNKDYLQIFDTTNIAVWH